MIRRMKPQDREDYLALAHAFYSSDAILTDPDPALFAATFDEMMRRNTYLEGFLLLKDDEVAGYAIVAKYFSPELGGMALWVDELFILPSFRSQGLGSEFFDFVRETYGPHVKKLRLEVEPDNERAISLYHDLGFETLPYTQMTLDTDLS